MVGEVPNRPTSLRINLSAPLCSPLQRTGLLLSSSRPPLRPSSQVTSAPEVGQGGWGGVGRLAEDDLGKESLEWLCGSVGSMGPGAWRGLHPERPVPGQTTVLWSSVSPLNMLTSTCSSPCTAVWRQVSWECWGPERFPEAGDREEGGPRGWRAPCPQWTCPSAATWWRNGCRRGWRLT